MIRIVERKGVLNKTQLLVEAREQITRDVITSELMHVKIAE